MTELSGVMPVRVDIG